MSGDGDQIHVVFSSIPPDYPDGDEIHVSFSETGAGGGGEFADVIPPTSLVINSVEPSFSFEPVIKNPKSDKSRLLYVWGPNRDARSGLGHDNVLLVPTLLSAIADAQPGENSPNWQGVAQNFQGSVVFASNSDRLYGWGDNHRRILMLSDPDYDLSITDITQPSRTLKYSGFSFDKFAVASTSNTFGVAFIDDGRLYTAKAYMSGGELQLELKQIGEFTDWQDISMATKHILAIRDGRLYAWYWNYSIDPYGVLGIGSPGGNVPDPVQVGGHSDWISVYAIGNRSFGIRDGGLLYAWGQGNNGVLGLGPSSSEVNTPQQVQGEGWQVVASSGSHTLGIRNGQLYAWGDNGTNALGILPPPPANVVYPELIDARYGWTKVSAGVSAGDGRSFGILNRTLYAWGWQGDGYLGNGVGDQSVQNEPTLIDNNNDWVEVSGESTNCGFGIREISSSPIVNLRTEPLEVGGYRQRRPPPTSLAIKIENPRYLFLPPLPISDLKINGLRPVRESDPVGNTPLNLRFNNFTRRIRALYTWGSNQNGITGLGVTTGVTESPVRVDEDIDVLGGWDRIALTATHVLAIKDGFLYVWGSNSFGQLGDGTIISQNTPKRLTSDAGWADVAVYGNVSYGIQHGRLYHWGQGIGLTPVQIVEETGWTRIAISSNHYLGIRNGFLYAWGENTFGQLGIGSLSGPHSQPTIVLTFPLILHGDWKEITVTNNASAGIRGDNNSLYTWGSVASGFVGNGSLDNVARTRPGLASTSYGWTRVVFGNCALAINKGKLYSWGSNSDGVTGQGVDSGTTLEPTQVGELVGWREISQRGALSLGVRNGVLYAWGRNASFVTQQGTDEGVTIAPAVVGGYGWHLAASGVHTSLTNFTVLATLDAELTYMPDAIPPTAITLTPLSSTEDTYTVIYAEALSNIHLQVSVTTNIETIVLAQGDQLLSIGEYPVFLSDAATVLDSVAYTLAIHFLSEADVTDDVLFTFKQELRSTLRAAIQVASTGLYKTEYISEASVTNALAYLLPVALVSEAHSTDSLRLGKIIRLLDRVRAHDSSITSVEALIALATTAWFSDQLYRIESISVSTESEASSEFIHTVIAFAQLADVLDSTEDLSFCLTVNFASEAAGVDTSLTTVEAIARLLSEGHSALFMLVLDNQRYLGHVVNTNTDAFSYYQNVEFDSLAWSYQDKALYAARPDGIYVFDADDDQGEPINAQVMTGVLDFQSTQLKRIDSAYLGYAGGKLLMRVMTTMGGRKQTHHYELINKPADTPTEGVIQIGKGLRSAYWQFELHNIDGAAFEVDNLTLYPVMLSRRRNS